MKIFLLTILLAITASAQTARRPAGKKSASGNAAKPEVIYRWDNQASGVEDDLLSVSFVNQQVGYAAGKANTILKTTDGGKTWARLLESRDGVDFHSIVFTSPTDGWATGRSLLHTSDGGESWQPAVPLPGPEGFGGGSMLGSARMQLHVPTMGAGVFRSDDGGRTWKSMGDVLRNDWETVFFVDDQHGWVAGNYGRLGATVDGGATWKELPPPLKGHFTKIQFISPQVGWLLPQGGSQGGPLATTDGGATWNTQYAGVDTGRPLMDMQFLNAQTGFLLAEANRNQLVLATQNGGKSWRTIGNIEKYARALSFPQADEGWAVGPRGYIVHYHKVVPEK
ncbi:MAG TPA: YCF48-related protein [Bryobacteraceae bacterium]|nr:YCF48-related protein [Bryobacteraceae bacterium]